MSEQRCPSEADVFRFVDADLSPEQSQRVERHLESCSICSKQVATLRALIEDVAASPETRLDVSDHVSRVMARLDEPVKSAPAVRFRTWSGLLAIAASLALFVFTQRERRDSPPEFAARGAHAEASLAREVGVNLYAQESALRPLEEKSRIRAGVALTAGLKNLGSETVYLLLFAMDAERAVHWIAPAFLSAETDPQSVSIVPSSGERLLPSAAVFDDLAPGTLSVMMLITREPRRVSEIEALPPSELSRAALERHFARAEVRQLSLDVVR